MQGIDKGNAGAGLNLLQSFKQELRSKRQAEGGNEDAVMQSAVSVCEGALGILKAALAGTLVSNQARRHSTVLYIISNSPCYVRYPINRSLYTNIPATSPPFEQTAF